MFALVALLGVIAVALFVFQLMLVVSDREEATKSGAGWDEARDGIVETGESVGNVVVGGFSAINYALGLISLPLLFFFLVLLILTAAGIGVAAFGSEMSTTFDSSFTEFWSPFYESFVLGVLDPVRALYNVIIPFTNSINGSWRILRLEALDIAADCKEVDWGQVALDLRGAIVSLMRSLTDYVLTFAGVDFDFYTPLTELQDAIETAAPVLTCWCDVSSELRAGVQILTTHHLAAVADRAINIGLSAIVDTVRSIVELVLYFIEDIKAHGFVDGLAEFYWDPARGPSYERTMRTVGQLAARLFDWVDDIVAIVLQIFFSIADDDVPRFFAVLGNYFESIILGANVGVDIYIKGFRFASLLGTRYVPAVWNESKPVAERYQGLITEAFDKAYNASNLTEEFFIEIAGAMNDVFNSSSHAMNETEQLLVVTGCISHEFLDVVAILVEMLVRLVVAMFHERFVGGEYGAWIGDDPMKDAFDRAIDSSIRFADCTGAFYSILDDELGQVVNETGHVIVAIIDPFVQLQRNWANRTEFLKSIAYRADVDNVFFEADAWAIAIGDFWRQFAFVTNSSFAQTHCRIRDVHLEQFPPTVTAVGGTEVGDWDTFYPFLVDPFCCLGSAFETSYRLIFGLIEGLVRGIVAFTTSATLKDGFVEAFGPDKALDIEREFLPMLDFFLRDLFRLSCIKGGVIRAVADVYFSGFDHVCDASGMPTWTVFEYAVDLITGVVRVPIKFVLGGAGILFQWLVIAIDGQTCSATCWCKTTAPIGRIQVLYEETLGPVFDWISEFLEIIACTFTGELPNLGTFATSLRDTLGTGSPPGSGSLISRGDLLCVLVAWTEDIWDLFVCWSKGSPPAGEGFFGCIADAAKKMITALMDDLGRCFTAWWNELEKTVGCLGKYIDTKCDPHGTIWCVSHVPLLVFDAILGGVCRGFVTALVHEQCVLASKKGGIALPDIDTRFPPTETFTHTQHACAQFIVHTPEWYDCLRNASANFTEEVTRSRHHTRSTTFTTEVITKTAPEYETETATWGYPPWIETYTRIAQTATITTIQITAVHAAEFTPPTFGAPDRDAPRKRAESATEANGEIGEPIATEIETANRYCMDNVTFAREFADARDLNEGSAAIGADQKKINRLLIFVGLSQANASHLRCVLSVLMAKEIDLGVGFVSYNETLTDPLTFYDMPTFVAFLYEAYEAASIALEYEMLTASSGVDSRTLTAADFYRYLEAKYNGIDDAVALFAIFAERVLRSARNIAGGSEYSSWFGHIIETLGQWFGGEQKSFVRASRVSSIDYYDDAPLHPLGWQSSKWVEFSERYSGMFRDGFARWKAGTGFRVRGLDSGYYTNAQNLIVARYEWNRDGRAPELEPGPHHGTIRERAVFHQLSTQSAASRYYWETEDLAMTRRDQATLARASLFPALTLAAQNKLIPDDVLCPAGVNTEDPSCGGRACWDASGVSVGRCLTHASPLFGSPECRCNYDAVTGACCLANGGCTDVVNAAACDPSTGTFSPVSTCASGVCADVIGACCAGNGTCAVSESDAACVGTFLTGSDCSACTDSDAIAGACCLAGNCSMTEEADCADGIWNVGQNCSSADLSSECGHCGAPACKSCTLLFNVVNDVVDLWIANMEIFEDNVTRGACCYGAIANRSCALLQRSDCDERTDSKWFWGEQCTFCSGATLFSFAGGPRRTRAQLEDIHDLERWLLDAFEYVVNTALRALSWLNRNVSLVAWAIPDAVDGATFSADAFVQSVIAFLFADDPNDPGNLRFWLEFLFVCDVLNDPLPNRGRQGLGLVEGFAWSTIVLTILYATIFRWWRFLGAFFAGALLITAWFLLGLSIAYFYSPACFAPAWVPYIAAPQRILQSRSSVPTKPGAQIPVVGVRTDRFARFRTRLSRLAQNVLLAALSTPIMPTGLANDIMKLLDLLDLKCLPYCEIACPREDGKWPCAWMTDEDAKNGISCLAEVDCCRVAECPPTRVFPDCSLEPYKFTSSTRELAYWVRTLFPQANCFLFHTDFFLFSWIRTIPSFREHFDFPGDECSEADFVDAKWEYCAGLNILLLAPWLIFFVVIGILFWGVVLLAWIVFKSFVKFGRRTGAFWTVVSDTTISLADEPIAARRFARDVYSDADPGGEFRARGHRRDRGDERRE